MKHRTLTATSLRLALSVSLFAIALLAGGLFYFADGQLHGVAVNVSHALVDASTSQNNVQVLQQIERQLADDKDVIARAKSIVADSQSYQYQDQIVGDLNKYAGKSGITITNIDFSNGSSTSSAPATNKTQTTSPQAAAPSGVKTTSVSVTLENPVGYQNFLKFLRYIEDNLTKMQVQKISLSKGTGSGDDVASDVLTIQVYVR
ncbi:MAG TPA: hypothetical protein VL481_03465 [Verrucomicrobiae bacterium]|jgi:hypothetical protein|nr:hypothetical protein [Verrucomicrobiae bacterium]